MRFLANENIEQPIIDALRAAGHDVASVGEIAPGSPDEDVLRLANIESRIVLTNDKDFGELIYRRGRASAGILLLRLESEDGAQKAARLMQIFPSVEGALTGRFTVLTEARARLRPLQQRVEEE